MYKTGRFIGIGLAGLLTLTVYSIVVLSGAAGDGYWLAVCATAGFGAATGALGWLLGRSCDRMKEAADLDFLTGVFTRRFLVRCFPKLVAKAERAKRKFAVVLIDLDEFKEVNDKLGHEAGDKLLRQVAGLLREQSRLGEIVGRIGGDEFLVLCPYGDSAGLEKYGERLRKKLNELSSDWNHPLSTSVGHAVFPEEGRTLEQLMRGADAKMYADKQKTDSLINRRLHA